MPDAKKKISEAQRRAVKNMQTVNIVQMFLLIKGDKLK